MAEGELFLRKAHRMQNATLLDEVILALPEAVGIGPASTTSGQRTAGVWPVITHAAYESCLPVGTCAHFLVNIQSALLGAADIYSWWIWAAPRRNMLHSPPPA